MGRRFGYVFEFDRNGPPGEGTPEQRAFVRATVAEYATYGSRFDRVLYSIAKSVKVLKYFIPIQWVVGLGANGYTYPYLMQLNAGFAPGYALKFTFLHELGHLVGRHLLNPIDKSEYWADQFAYWVMNNCPDGTVQDRIVYAL